MNITNAFFNTEGRRSPETVYMMPRKASTRAGYDFAEFEAARSAILQAFEHGNWDGYGALPISDKTKMNALSALKYIENLTAAPEIALNPNGTLTLEWDTNHGLGQLEIGRTRYSFFVQPHTGRVFLDTGDVTEVNPIVGLLVDALLFPKPSQPVTGLAR